ADLVDLFGFGVRLGPDSAHHRIHRVVLAQPEGHRRRARAGEAAVSARREATPASVPAVRRGDALDVANLPSYGFSHRSLMWWGTAGMCAIEGTAFAFAIVIYFYLRSLADTWPSGGGAPGLLWGTLNLVLILASAIPNHRCDK